MSARSNTGPFFFQARPEFSTISGSKFSLDVAPDMANPADTVIDTFSVSIAPPVAFRDTIPNPGRSAPVADGERLQRSVGRSDFFNNCVSSFSLTWHSFHFPWHVSGDSISEKRAAEFKGLFH